MRYIATRILCASLTCLGLVACSAQAGYPDSPNSEPAMTTQTQDKTQDQAQTACNVNMTMDRESAVANWRAVNDGVMGGRSSGGPRFDTDHMVFDGTINTNGGGFSSIRLPLNPGGLSQTDGVTLKVMGDGREYKLSFQTTQNWRGRYVSWQAPIPTTTPGEWETVTVPFDALEPSIFGRSVRADPFDKSDVREIGIIIADGRDGPFSLRVAGMGCA